MKPFSKCLALFAMLTGQVLLPCLAASLAASSISESIGVSIGSASASIQRSSASSSKTAAIADGDYKIIDVAALRGRPDTLQLTLRPIRPADTEGNRDDDPEGEFLLVLPQTAFDQGRLAPGKIVKARQHRYGLEFVNADSLQAFFLVLDDDWFRELQPHAVTL